MNRLKNVIHIPIATRKPVLMLSYRNSPLTPQQALTPPQSVNSSKISSSITSPSAKNKQLTLLLMEKPELECSQFEVKSVKNTQKRKEVHYPKLDNCIKLVNALSMIGENKENTQLNKSRGYINSGRGTTQEKRSKFDSQKFVIHDSKNKQLNAKIISELRAKARFIDFFPYLKQEILMDNLRIFLSLKDYLSYLMISKKLYNESRIREKVSLTILKIPLKNRLSFWTYHCRTKIESHNYTYYCSQYTDFAEDIVKDLDRTFPKNHSFYACPLNKTRLFNVLRAFAVKNPEFGYIQGFNFITGYLLLQFDEEVNIDYILEHFLDH